jgi:hypothetical protein
LNVWATVGFSVWFSFIHTFGLFTYFLIFDLFDHLRNY